MIQALLEFTSEAPWLRHTQTLVGDKNDHTGQPVMRFFGRLRRSLGVDGLDATTTTITALGPPGPESVSPRRAGLQSGQLAAVKGGIGMKITVLLSGDELVGTIRDVDPPGPQEASTVRATVVPMSGQRMREIDVPDEFSEIADAAELHEKLSEHLPESG